MVSTIGGPIPPHPYYDKEASDFLNRAPGRNRPEAEVYAKQGQGSIGNILQIQGTSFGAPSIRKYSEYQLFYHTT